MYRLYSFWKKDYGFRNLKLIYLAIDWFEHGFSCCKLKIDCFLRLSEELSINKIVKANLIVQVNLFILNRLSGSHFPKVGWRALPYQNSLINTSLNQGTKERITEFINYYWGAYFIVFCEFNLLDDWWRMYILLYWKCNKLIMCEFWFQWVLKYKVGSFVPGALVFNL